MQGRIPKARLECGGATTTATLWVAEHVPADLLLGRPWQRRNLVTIDERANGTYLVFNPLNDQETTLELLVQGRDLDYPDNATLSTMVAQISLIPLDLEIDNLASQMAHIMEISSSDSEESKIPLSEPVIGTQLLMSSQAADQMSRVWKYWQMGNESQMRKPWNAEAGAVNSTKFNLFYSRKNLENNGEIISLSDNGARQFFDHLNRPTMTNERLKSMMGIQEVSIHDFVP